MTSFEKVNDIEIKIIEKQPDREVILSKDNIKDQIYTIDTQIADLEAKKVILEAYMAECDKLEIKTSEELIASKPEEEIKEEIIEE